MDYAPKTTVFNRMSRAIRAWRGESMFSDGTGTWVGPHSISHVGRRVNEKTAMQTATVFACVRVISETLASLPIHIYERSNELGASKRVASNHPLQMLIHKRPNPELTKVEFWELVIGHMELRGNAFVEIERSGKTDVPIALWPLDPTRVKIVRGKNGKLIYEVSVSGGGTPQYIAANNMLHLRTMPRGHYGVSPIASIIETIGLQIAGQEFGARVFNGDGLMRTALQTDQVIRDADTIKDLKDTWVSAVGGGLSNAFRLSVLHSGLKPVNIGINPADAQLLELMNATSKDIVRAWRIPPHKVGIMDNATFTNIEHQGIEFVQDTVVPRVARIEAALDRAILGDDPKYFIKFNVDALLRGDFATRMKGYVDAFQNAILNPNEIRDLEDMAPYDGGDTYFAPMNLAPVTTIIKPESIDGEADTRQRDTREAPRTQRDTTPLHQSIRDTWKPVIQRTIERTMLPWGNRIKKGAQKYLQTRDAENWDDFAEQFLEAAGLELKRELLPVFSGMAKQIAERAASSYNNNIPAMLSEFVEAIAETKAKMGTGFSAAQLQAIKNNSSVEYIVEQFAPAWNKGVEGIASQMAEQSVVGLDGDISRLTWRENGVTRLQWVAAGSDTCDLCQALDGRIVGIERAFSGPNDLINGGEGQADLKPTGNILFPPLHDGCVCSIIPA
jgi:HK97 family phage portal protein